MESMVPVWVTILVGVAGAGLGLVGTLIGQWVTRKNSREATAVSQQVADTDRSKSDRELILQALELLRRRNDPNANRQGAAMLLGLSKMTGLSEDDAVFVDTVMRPVTDPALDRARKVIEVEGDVGFTVEYDESQEGEDR